MPGPCVTRCRSQYPRGFGICSGKSILEVPILPYPSLQVLLSITCCHMTLTSCQFSIPSPIVQPAALQGFAFSVLHMQVYLPTPICSSLRGVVDILASGRAPVSVSKFVAGGSLTALVKNKEGHPLDIHPIVVGEALRRLTGKCLCIITKPKASDFFTPFQYGVACPDGAEKVIHGVRSCIQEHWKDDNFTVCKVDMSNAFNLVSRQALLEECAVHFPELLPWVGWCYGSHPTLWHPLGQLSSETGVQVDLFSLVLHKLVLSIAQDKDCLCRSTDGTLTMVLVRTLSGCYPGGDSHSRDGSIFGAVYQCF